MRVSIPTRSHLLHMFTQTETARRLVVFSRDVPAEASGPKSNSDANPGVTPGRIEDLAVFKGTVVNSDDPSVQCCSTDLELGGRSRPNRLEQL
jgi:hypothetical protein